MGDHDREDPARAAEHDKAADAPTRLADAAPQLANGSVDDVAALLRERPAQRDQILRALHTQRGNAFVAQVVSVSAAPTATKGTLAGREEDDGSGVPGPSGSRFTGDGTLGEVERGGRELKSGDTGAAVRKLQVALAELNFRPIQITGTYDAATEKQVTAYQVARKLARHDGVLDATTFETLEKEFTTGHYADAARHAPPGMANNPKWGDADHPEPVLLTETHALSDEEKAEANAVISPAKSGPTVGKFKESLGTGMSRMYGPRMLKLLQAKIDDEYKEAESDKEQHDDGDTFSMDRIVSLGNAAKTQVDGVFGSWATGPEMKADVTLKDRFTADRAKQGAMKPEQLHDSAKSRARYFLNTVGAFEGLDKEHSADRTRPAEAKIIDQVLEVVTRDNEKKLLLITATWAASTDRKGIIKMQRTKSKYGDDGDRSMLWGKFMTMVHEYLHSLVHPRWHEYRDAKGDTDPQGGHTLGEGVTEFLTRIAISQIDRKDPKLHKAVLGGLVDGEEPELDRSSYGAAYGRAQALAGVVGVHNLYAAYFLGQTKLIGA